MELLPFERARITEIAYFYTYCDRAVWIAKRLGIVAPPSIEMFQGTVMHEIIRFAERKLHIFAKEDSLSDNLSSEKDIFENLRNYFHDHIQELMLSEKKNNFNEACEHFNEVQIELAISEVLDQMTYAYFNRYFNCMKLKSYSMANRSTVREKKISFRYKTIFVNGTPDFRDNFEKKDVVLLDYKRSKDPKITDYMRIQANGYAFLIKRDLGLNVVNAIFEFPLYGVQRFCSVEDFEPYIDGFIAELSQDKPPYYFESKNCCKWCNPECKRKCLELR